MRLLVGVVLLCCAAASRELPAQIGIGPIPPGAGDPERVNALARVLGLNAAVGAVTAGLQRLVRGEPLLVHGVAGGALGSGIAYLGKHIAVRDGWGVVGRQISAVGISVVRNAAAGRGLFDELVAPLGPVRLYLATRSGVRLRPELDFAAAAATLAAATRSGASLDLGASLAAGAPVFVIAQSPLGSHQRGVQAAGVITLWPSGEPFRRRLSDEQRARWFAHERVHVLQYDFASLAWIHPAESWLLGRFPAGRAMRPYVAFNALGAAIVPLERLWEYDAQPWEREAHFLSGSK